MDDLIALYQANPALAVLALAGAAAVEYVFPPFPGDVVTLGGAFLVAAGGGNPVAVVGATLAGTLVGAMADFYLGRFLQRHTHLLSPSGRRIVHGLGEKFRRHGEIYLVINRFIPVGRAFFLLAAGMAGMRPSRVLLYAGLSGGLWNGLLIGAGMLAGRNLERLKELFVLYQTALLSVLAAILALYLLRFLRRRWRPRPSPEASGEEPGSES
jgi:membrane protein DedA with SNARE-associated domain